MVILADLGLEHRVDSGPFSVLFLNCGTFQDFDWIHVILMRGRVGLFGFS